MSPNRRPVSVTILGCVYLAIGAIGFVYHLTDLKANNPFRYDALWVELVEFVAIVCGVFLLRGQNWARWIALAWMAFHVVLSAFHALGEFAIHLVFLIIISWLLFRADAALFFRHTRTDSPR